MAYIASSEPPPHPPSWDFSKVAAKGGWKIFTRNREVVVLCGDGKFLRSLYIVGRGVLTPLFYEDPPYIANPPPFSNFVQPPPPMFFLFSCLFDWMGDHATFGVLFYLMDLHMSSLGTLVPERPWCVLWNKAWNSLFWHIIWIFTGTLI